METPNSITKYNYAAFLAVFIENNKLATRNIAEVIGCAEPVINRLIAGKTWPTDEMIKQSGIMFELGFKVYKKLTKAQKERISETIGTFGGVGLGFGSVTAAVSALGTVGLSAAGITSGLAVLGGVVGGGMAAGLLVVASIPLAAGAVGYAIIKGVKGIIDGQKLKDENYNPFWEKPIEMNSDEKGMALI
jgi:hypothetical protein